MNKIYKLEIERNQYDRIAETFNEPNGLIAVGYDGKKDTVIFTITEQLRKRFAKWGKKNNTINKCKRRKDHAYWIVQMFLPKNINQYEVR
tara:strand:- start:169 stop:438 length:270 start_codon:yes stop_codon:yes gene_type:complete